MTPELLRRIEQHYAGGIVNLGLRPSVASPLDHVPSPKSVFDGHRMQLKSTHRGKAREYAQVYSDYLAPRRPRVVVEMGILRGIGLAIWADLFPGARIIGLDHDLSHYQGNEANLFALGAFRARPPEVHQYDELDPDAATRLRRILAGDTIDVFIDDALHYDAAILKSLDDVLPLMSPGGVYFVEDNFTVHRKIRLAHPEKSVDSVAEMTVVT